MYNAGHELYAVILYINCCCCTNQRTTLIKFRNYISLGNIGDLR
jgi:hypothetical protein